MKKKLLWCTGIILLITVIILGVWRYIEVRNRQTDPDWKLALRKDNINPIICSSIVSVVKYPAK